MTVITNNKFTIIIRKDSENNSLGHNLKRNPQKQNNEQITENKVNFYLDDIIYTTPAFIHATNYVAYTPKIIEFGRHSLIFAVNKNLTLFQIRFLNHIVTKLVQHNSKLITISSDINSIRKTLGYTYYISKKEQAQQLQEFKELFDLQFLTKYTNNNKFSRLNLDNENVFDNVLFDEKIEAFTFVLNEKVMTWLRSSAIPISREINQNSNLFQLSIFNFIVYQNFHLTKKESPFIRYDLDELYRRFSHNETVDCFKKKLQNYILKIQDYINIKLEFKKRTLFINQSDAALLKIHSKALKLADEYALKEHITETQEQALIKKHGIVNYLACKRYAVDSKHKHPIKHFHSYLNKVINHTEWYESYIPVAVNILDKAGFNHYQELLKTSNTVEELVVKQINYTYDFAKSANNLPNKFKYLVKHLELVIHNKSHEAQLLPTGDYLCYIMAMSLGLVSRTFEKHYNKHFQNLFDLFMWVQN